MATSVGSRWWVRLPRGLLAAAVLFVLTEHRPPLPTTLWATIKPTRIDEARETLALVLWLLLVVASLAALRSVLTSASRRAPMNESEPIPVPRRRSRGREVQRQQSAELLAVFATPRPSPVSSSETDRDALATGSATATATQAPTIDAKEPEPSTMLRLFGPLTIDASEGAGITQRATRGLIAYLALKRGPASSDELLEALWPGEPPTRTIRQRLWKAKGQAHTLLGDALRRRHDGYELDRKRLRCDLDEIERLRRHEPTRERLEQALELMHGEPLADIDYPWADNERRRLQAVLADTLIQLADARLEQADANGALNLAEQLIDLDPLNEHGWCVAMRAEAALGQRQAILDRYEKLTHELDDRLGLRPAAETRETYHRILSQD